jgi:hypothetical protein
MYIISILTLVWSLTDMPAVHAQITAAEKQLLLNEVGDLGRNWNSSFRVFDERYEGVRGSPLLYEEWRDGHVVFEDGRELSYEKLFNIDATTGELLIVLPSNNIVALPSTRIHSVSKILDSPMYLARVYSCGDITLYYAPLKKFKAADYKGAYSPDRRYDEYIDEPVVLAKVGSDFRDLKLKKKQVVKALEDVMPDIGDRVQGGKFEMEELCGWLQ